MALAAVGLSGVIAFANVKELFWPWPHHTSHTSVLDVFGLPHFIGQGFYIAVDAFAIYIAISLGYQLSKRMERLLVISFIAPMPLHWIGILLPFIATPIKYLGVTSTVIAFGAALILLFGKSWISFVAEEPALTSTAPKEKSCE
jgi:hypothetical protein